MRQDCGVILVSSCLLHGNLTVLFYFSIRFCLLFLNSNTGDVKRWEIYFRAQSILNMTCSVNECILGQKAAITSAGRIHLAVRQWREDVWCLQGTGKQLQHSESDWRRCKAVRCIPYLCGCGQLEYACPEARAWKVTCSSITWWCLNLSCFSLSSYFLVAKMHFLKNILLYFLLLAAGRLCQILYEVSCIR